MTDHKQPKHQADEVQDQTDLELDEEQTDEVKGGIGKVRYKPDQESGRRFY